MSLFLSFLFYCIRPADFWYVLVIAFFLGFLKHFLPGELETVSKILLNFVFPNQEFLTYVSNDKSTHFTVTVKKLCKILPLRNFTAHIAPSLQKRKKEQNWRTQTGKILRDSQTSEAEDIAIEIISLWDSLTLPFQLIMVDLQKHHLQLWTPFTKNRHSPILQEILGMHAVFFSRGLSSLSYNPSKQLLKALKPETRSSRKSPLSTVYNQNSNKIPSSCSLDSRLSNKEAQTIFESLEGGSQRSQDEDSLNISRVRPSSEGDKCYTDSFHPGFTK